MNNNALLSFIDLFIAKGDKELCSVYGLKQRAEKFIGLFVGGNKYVSKEAAFLALTERGVKMEGDTVYGEWVYPSFSALRSALGGEEFNTIFTNSLKGIPFYAIPSDRVRAMIEAHSTAWIKNGNRDFPIFDRYHYERLNWKEVEDGGILAYRVDDDVIMLDTIYVTKKRSGTGTALFQSFLNTLCEYDDEMEVVVDAYTDDSKEFFKRIASRYAYVKPTNRFNKSDVYSFFVKETK